MTTINTRASVLALTEETTEGTPVAPTSGTEFIALQDDFSMEPSFDVLENAEIRASIGKGKPTLGGENPKAGGSHYLRHSGVEGTAPGYRKLLKAAFGTETVKSTQRLTTSSSTTTLIKGASGVGTDFERGQPLLVKGAAGYEIRCVHSVSTDDITPSFPLANAPGTGVGLGKAVFYKPANSGHVTLSPIHYLGNQGAVQMMSGARVTELSATFDAGEYINMSYSLEGLTYYFNFVNVTATDTKLDFEDDSGVHAATIAAGFYKDPHELADAVATAMNASGTAQTYTVSYLDASGKYKIVGTGTLLSLKLATGTNTANSIGDKMGFGTADLTGTGATTGYTAATAMSWTAAYTPTLDNTDPLVAKNNEVLLGDGTTVASLSAASVGFTLSNSRSVQGSVAAVSGRSGSKITAREVKVTITAPLDQNDVDKFRRFREGSETRFQYNFGVKSGGNWVPGKCGALYCPTMTITSFKIDDVDGVATLSAELAGYVDSNANGECYLGFV